MQQGTQPLMFGKSMDAVVPHQLVAQRGERDRGLLTSFVASVALFQIGQCLMRPWGASRPSKLGPSQTVSGPRRSSGASDHDWFIVQRRA
ncbi:MAG TPA: hypothetical protein VMR43_10890 [Variovorax sp.]|nr:hypothetical protein [Variovorax sp.]